MSIQPIRIPMTAAALALLLAACGGGGSSGSDRAVSSSPNAPGAGSTLNVNVDANSTAIANAGSDAGATAGQSGTPGQSSGNSGEANATGSGSGSGAGGPSNSDSSSNASSTPITPPATGATPTPTPPTAGTTPTPPAAGADAGAATPPVAPAPGVTTPPAAPAEVAPVSAQGVRGDVFVAMLEQKPCEHDSLVPAEGPDGSKGSEGMINFYADTSLGNYKNDPNYVVVGFRHALGCNGKFYEPIKPGDHNYSISHTVFAKFYRPPRPFNLFGMSVPVNLTAEDVTVGTNMETRSVAMPKAEGQPSQEFTPVLTADSPYKVKLNELVPFGTLKQWANGAQLGQLMVLQGGSPREVRMCWNLNLDHVKRLQCMIWNVPEDWKAGGKLTPVNVTLEEDRSVYEGETGKAYWN